jgi:AraC-like DNA-binding protein
MHPETMERLVLARDRLAETPLALGDAAKEACLSPFYFHRSFTLAFGQTPHEFANEQRLLRARQLLLETDCSVLEIALTVGYATHARFSVAFRDRFGCSPKDFRLGARRFWAVTGWRTHLFIPMCMVNRRLS